MSPRYRGVPKPPPHLWDQLIAANASGDHGRIEAAEAAVRAWAIENGYERPEGTTRPDEAVQ